MMEPIDEMLDFLFWKIDGKHSYITSKYVITKEDNNKTCQIRIIKKVQETAYESNI